MPGNFRPTPPRPTPRYNPQAIQEKRDFYRQLFQPGPPRQYWEYVGTFKRTRLPLEWYGPYRDWNKPAP